jgi:hypothetical protein
MVMSILVWKVALYPQKHLLSTSSPNSIYRIELKKEPRSDQQTAEEIRLDRPYVTATVYRGDQLFAEGIVLSSEGAFDTPFEGMYPNHIWLSDKTIRFGPKSYFNQPSDILFITNDSAKVIKYLRIDSTEIYLLFDVQPNESISFPVYWPEVKGINFKNILVRGMFNDGTLISPVSTNFPYTSSSLNQMNFCAIIAAKDINISSQELEGFRLQDSNKLKVSKSKDCGLK